VPPPPPTHEGKERGWEGLATFLFGPDWFSIPLEGEDAAIGVSSSHASERGGTGGCEGGKSLQTNNAKSFSTATLKAPGGKGLIPNPQNSSSNNNTNVATPKVGKGKQLSNMIGFDKTVSFSLDHQHPTGGNGTDAVVPGIDGGPSNDVSSVGWNAPYLNDIPPFPLVTNPEDVANPHRLSGTKIPLSMHCLATETEACRETPSSTKLRKASGDDTDTKLARRDEAVQNAMRRALRIPDDVYSTIDVVWGSIRNADDLSNKTKTGVDSKMTPIADASKVECATSSLSQNSSDPNASDSIRMPPYVPNFFPPFPTDHFSDMANDKLATSMATSAVMINVLSRMHKRAKRKSSDIAPDGTKQGVLDRDALRRSVISLSRAVGPTYWGSVDVYDDVGYDKKRKGDMMKGSKVSNSGKLDVFVAPGEGKGSSSAAKKFGPDASQQILPLGRASGSRVRTLPFRFEYTHPFPLLIKSELP
jgi:hypothetical protein